MSSSTPDQPDQPAQPDLVGLLAAGERAAFHGRPDSGVAPLERASALAAEQGLAAEAAGARWLLGVCLSAAGRYGTALETLEPLVAAAQTPQTKVIGALAAATIGSVQRQLGRHAVAQGYDETALDLATDTDEGRFDALLGLAADAVGLGDGASAAQRLEEARQVVGQRPQWWRQRVRFGWVEAELALLGNQPEQADQAATAAVELAERSGAPRHVAKGLLFSGVAQIEAGRSDEAAATLRRAARLAESLGTVPLQWPVRAVLGALLAGTAPEDSARSLEIARGAVQRIAADLPAPLHEEWLNRPDVAALLATG